MPTSSCTEEKLIVETVKGTYIIPTADFVRGTCDAHVKCTQLGAILAPFTEKSEFDIVMEALNSCEYQNPYESKWVGLHILSDNSSRVFSNGEEFDFSLHGHLYQENDVDMPEDCPNVILDQLRTNKLQIGTNHHCRAYKRTYICLKAKKTTNYNAINSDTTNVQESLVFAGGSVLFVILVCLIGYLTNRIKVLKLKLQQNSNDV